MSSLDPISLNQMADVKALVIETVQKSHGFVQLDYIENRKPDTISIGVSSSNLVVGKPITNQVCMAAVIALAKHRIRDRTVMVFLNSRDSFGQLKWLGTATYTPTLGFNWKLNDE